MNATAAAVASRSASKVADAAGPLSAQLAVNDFELFDIAQRFNQDRAALDARWKTLQREAHPDKFSAQGTAAQRVAMQWSVRINEAYQRLKDPLRRAAYLCELAGAPIDAENNTSMPAEFLMQQMQWREELDDATTADSLENLYQEVLQTREAALANCETWIDQAQDFAKAAQQVRALMFIERFVKDIDTRLDQLDAA
jgi:molecular chaperone HscB